MPDRRRPRPVSACPWSRSARSSEPHVGDVAEREHDAVDQFFDDLLRAHVDAGRPVVGEGGRGRGDELGGRGGVLARPVVDGIVAEQCHLDATEATLVGSQGADCRGVDWLGAGEQVR